MLLMEGRKNLEVWRGTGGRRYRDKIKMGEQRKVSTHKRQELLNKSVLTNNFVIHFGQCKTH